MSNPIKLTASHINQFLTARTYAAVSAKTARKTIWASIRDVYRIPKSVKLGVHLDNPADPLYGNLYEKGSRALLMADQYGAFTGVGTQAQAAQAAPANTADPTPQVSVVGNAGLSRYISVKADDLKSLESDLVCPRDIVQRPDCGRIAYDKDTDSILVRLDA